jgi:transposase
LEPGQTHSGSEMVAKLPRFSAMERMMKLQDVLLKAMATKITWWQAAEIIGVTDRTMRRWRERLKEDGYSGLADRRKGKASSRRVPLKTCKEVLRLYQEKYFDLNIRHFHEKLREAHGIELSYTWVQPALQRAGLSEEARAAWAAPAARRKTTNAGYDAAHRWEQAPVVSG